MADSRPAPKLHRASLYWLLPLLLFALLWMVITQGAAASWVVGIPCIILALVAFRRLSCPARPAFRPSALIGFAVWFFWQSLRGGLDVARRALRPRMTLNPGFLRYRLSVPPGPARVFLINSVSLLPGTLSADVDGDELLLHMLDTQADVMAETREVERRIRQLYGIEQGAKGG